MENKDIEFKIKRGILDNSVRSLILNTNFIKFENSDLASNPFIIFERNEITEFRFGMKWISLDVTFGREYFIYIRNNEKKVMKINFKTYFGYKKAEYQMLYRDIIINLEQLYFGPIVDACIKKYQKNENFQIGDVHFSKDHVKIGVGKVFNKAEFTISWEDVRIKEYQSYIAIYSAKDPMNCNKGFSYLEDWNSLVLCSFMKSVLHAKNEKEN